MKDFKDSPPPFDIVPLSDHFDYLEALQNDEYYHKGIILQILFEKEKEEFPSQVFADLMDRLVLRTDSSVLTILCPLFSIEMPKGNSKFASVRDLLVSIKYSIDDMPYSIQSQLLPKIAVFSQIVNDQDYVPDWFKLIIEDPLGNSRIQCKMQENATTNTTATTASITLKECYDRDPNVFADFFTRTEADCVEFDLIMNIEERPNTLYGDNALEKIIELFQKSSKILGLTGAGISVESGISAFRNSGNSQLQNIWDKWNQDEMTYQNILSRKKIRDDYFEMHAFLKEQISKAEPNGSHHLFASLKEKGKLLKVITQNIDGMHQKAGLSDENVIEIHGSSRGVVCTKCRTMVEDPEAIYSQVKDLVLQGKSLPDELTKCNQCGCDGVLKPNTISFGEELQDSKLIEARQQCRECDLMIIMGTRLLVSPVNQLPKLVAARDIPVVIINLESTPFDRNCVAVLNGKSGEMCNYIIGRLNSDNNNSQL